jgi:hypothetical protein
MMAPGNIKESDDMIGDIVQLVKDIVALTKSDDVHKAITGASSFGSRDSIIRKARDMVAVFPVLVSDSIDRDSVMTLTKALEVEYASLMRTVLSMHGVVNLGQGQTKADLVKNYHQNTRMGLGMSQALNAMRREGTAPTGGFPDERAVIEACRDMLCGAAQELNLGNLNEMTVRSVSILKENIAATILPKGMGYDSKDKVRSPKEGISSEWENSDVKKFSQMEPLLMKIQIEYLAQGVIQSTELVFGVKCMPHPITSSEMVYYIGESIKNNNVVFRTIQWMTGEIKFWRDMVLTMDSLQREAIMSAKATSKSSAKWWNKLRGMAASSRFKNAFSPQKMLPNCTMVLSQAEVEQIKMRYGIDFMDSRNVEKLITLYFLLRAVVMNDPDEAVHIYDEETSDWQVYSYAALNKQGSANQVKELVSLLSK